MTDVHPRVSIVIPTWNEAASIGRVLDDIPAHAAAEILVIDAGSTDATREEAAARGARVVVEPKRGYGTACLRGIREASDPDILVFLDGDYSDRPAELPALLAPILDGRADVVIGSRLAGVREPGALPWHAVFGNRLAAALIRLLYGVAITDLGPFRVVRADVVAALGLREPGYGWAVEMILRAALQHWRIVEVPVSYHPRIGQSKITGTVRGSIGAGWSIISRILQYRLHASARVAASQMTRPS